MSQRFKKQILDELVVPDHYRVAILWVYHDVGGSGIEEYQWYSTQYSGVPSTRMLSAKYPTIYTSKEKYPTFPWPAAFALFPGGKNSRGGGRGHTYHRMEDAIAGMPPQSILLAKSQDPERE